MQKGESFDRKRFVFLGRMQRVRKEMYDDVFSELRELSEVAGESPRAELEPEVLMRATESPSGRFRVLTPRQRARLLEPTQILYLG